MRREKLLVLIFVFSLAVTRFNGLWWGKGFFFHPDENNMARAISQLSWPDLNPHFFAYGQLPLYLVYFSYQLIYFFSSRFHFQPVSFSQAIYGLRFWSALFSIGTVLIGWRLAGHIFSEKRWQRIYLLLLIFSPGLIQIAHFGTTEAILTFVALALAYFAINYNLIILTLVSAIGLATKVSATLFLLGPMIIIWMKEKKFYLKIKKIFFWIGSTLFLTLVFSPFNFLDFQEFVRIVRYEAGVARGSIPVFYTRQFIDTKPIIFQLIKIFPWILGSPLFIFLMLSLIICGWQINYLIFSKKRKKILNSSFLILNSIFWPWFLFNSFLFAKWTRFMTPILPFLILFIVGVASKVIRWLELKTKKKQLLALLVYSCLFLSLLPGFLFTRLYFLPDIRYQASVWINQNLPPKAIILSEAGNVVDLPLFNQRGFQVINFDFYSLDEDQQQQQRLRKIITEADYILLPSRRVFANHLRLSSQFPKTAEFYRQLFSGELGFKLVKEFRPFGFWGELFLGSDLSAEETWTVFDHPTIRLFARLE